MDKFVLFLIENKVVIITVMLVVSEALAMIPQVKANSLAQLVINSLKWLKEKLAPAK